MLKHLKGLLKLLTSYLHIFTSPNKIIVLQKIKILSAIMEKFLNFKRVIQEKNSNQQILKYASRKILKIKKHKRIILAPYVLSPMKTRTSLKFCPVFINFMQNAPTIGY